MAKIHHLDASHINIPGIPVHQYIYSFLERSPDRLCMVNATTDIRMTCEEVLNMSKAFATGLFKMGMRCGDTISIYAHNSCELVCLVLGALQIGGCVNTTNPASTKYELQHVLADIKPKFIFTNSTCLENVEYNTKMLEKVRILVHRPVEGYFCISEWLLATDQERKESVTDITSESVDLKDHVAFILFSSGTTGLPKGVQLTHHNIVAHLCLRSAMLIEQAPFQVQTAEICPFPMHHVAGLFSGIYGAIPIGTVFIFLEHYSLEVLLMAIDKYKPAGLFAPPTVAVQLAKSDLVNNYDVSSVCFVRTGAAPVKKETEVAFMAKFNNPILVQGYGMTETVAGFIRSGIDQKGKRGTTGTPLSGIKIKIINPSTGELLGPNVKGEVCVSGPVIMKGYLNRPEATKATIDDNGWLHTGDLAYYDEDGFFFIVDRIKELIKYKGYQVAPAELEDVLLNHPDIMDVGVIGVPDKEAGELPKAFIVRKGPGLTEDMIHSYLKDRVAYYKFLRGGIVFTKSIPKLSSGKILRRELAKAAANSKF